MQCVYAFLTKPHSLLLPTRCLCRSCAAHHQPQLSPHLPIASSYAIVPVSPPCLYLCRVRHVSDARPLPVCLQLPEQEERRQATQGARKTGEEDHHLGGTRGDSEDTIHDTSGSEDEERSGVRHSMGGAGCEVTRQSDRQAGKLATSRHVGRGKAGQAGRVFARASHHRGYFTRMYSTHLVASGRVWSRLVARGLDSTHPGR